MAQTLDFNKLKKNYLTIVLNDEDKTRLQVMTPTKRLLSELMSLLPDISGLSGDMPTDEDLDALYEFCARLMSRNKAGKKITKEQLAEVLDFEDMIVFFEVYTDFVTEISGSKN